MRSGPLQLYGFTGLFKCTYPRQRYIYGISLIRYYMKYQLLTQKKDEDTIKATWLVPRKLIRQLKHFAADDDTNVSALAIQAIEEYIERRLKK
jgi:hypothetical protein